MPNKGRPSRGPVIPPDERVTQDGAPVVAHVPAAARLVRALRELIDEQIQEAKP